MLAHDSLYMHPRSDVSSAGNVGDAHDSLCAWLHTYSGFADLDPSYGKCAAMAKIRSQVSHFFISNM
jgi:hypothetical protein